MQSDSKTYGVITTIQPPTAAVRKLTSHLNDKQVIVIGDEKSPSHYPCRGAKFYDLKAQRALTFSLTPLLPFNHYSRKNIGYLLAIEQGASCLYDTDDDNVPLDTWKIRSSTSEADLVTASPWVNATGLFEGGWINVYSEFCDRSLRLWPRGMPIEQANGEPKWNHHRNGYYKESLIQQGMADLSPDVDVICRSWMRDPTFKKRVSLALSPKCWCPINSQSTWWFPAAFPLLYLPSYCSFRVCDIWRGLIAQRCLWAMDSYVVFHSPSEVSHQRNNHNFLDDLRGETPNHLLNDRVRSTLESLALARGPGYACDNLLACIEALVRAGIMNWAELNLAEAWVDDISRLNLKPSHA